MQQKTFIQNKKVYLAYNEFRKSIFLELAPKDGEAILYLLPWMLSVNDPAVPGYVPDLRRPIGVFGATTNPALIQREASFKTLLRIRKSGSLLKPAMNVSIIQGLYTIGSVGTLAQTPYSDCDIWVCIDKENFDDPARAHLWQKVNLVKDWMDAHLRIPVYFFICDLEDVRNSNFGVSDEESSGSAQRNVLKDEFYRTSVLICGKIPLWWVCFDPGEIVDYQAFSSRYAKEAFADYDCIDMGAPAPIDRDEYFGAALWQFNKALTHPLKSVMKMLLLEMLLASDNEGLLCERFRSTILDSKREPVFQDPSVLTLHALLAYSESAHPGDFEFILQCAYLRHDLHFFGKKVTFKEKLAKDIFAHRPLTREQIFRLNAFADWRLTEHLAFGSRIFNLLLNIYRRIMAPQRNVVSGLTRHDMTVMGRKLAVCLEKKRTKIEVVHRPLFNPTYPALTFLHDTQHWVVTAAGEPSKPVIVSGDIVHCITHLAWNGLYEPSSIRMTPNATPVTLQEIHNLAKRIHDIFGAFDITAVDFSHFQEPEKVTDMLVIVNFESQKIATEMMDFCIIYGNHWGELYFRRFHSQEQFREFIESGKGVFRRTNMHYYLQRSSLYYEKTIERTKQIIQRAFAGQTASF